MLFCSGVGDQTENLIFPAIIDRNAAGFFNCYKKGDELFKRLAEELNKFKVRLYRTEQTKKINLRKYCSTITNSIIIHILGNNAYPNNVYLLLLKHDIC